MFNKLLIKALGKRFNKLSPEEKQNVREMVNNETISETTEKQKVKKRKKKTMADEKEVKTNSSLYLSIISRLCWPIDPVAPRSKILFIIRLRNSNHYW